MKPSASELFKKALDLDDRDRATLAGILIESLEEEPDPDLERIWKAEVQRRIKELDSGDVKAVPWEDVKDRLLKRRHG